MNDDSTGGGPPAEGEEETRDPLAPPSPATYAGRKRQAGEAAAEESVEAASEEAPAEEKSAEESVEAPAEESVEAPAAEGAEEAVAEPAEEAVEESAEAPAVDGEEQGGTVEADSVALADREEAREAALAAVRARAAKKETKLTAAAAPAVDAGEPAPRRGLWARFIAASLVIVTSTATATALTGLLVLTDLARGLGDIQGVRHQLTTVDGGEPQTLLILGSDQRSGAEKDAGRSDTTLLLRLDPDQDEIRLLSLPRDLRVNIAGYGIDKLNAAYTEGGPSLTLKTVKQLTGMEINHVVNVDFLGFAEAVNEIDCVYVDVDRHYFVPPRSGVSEIDVSAGYQRLCGLKALQYVRYRHTDNDLVRAARQQDFLREARQKVPPSKLLEDWRDLTDIFERHTESSIKRLGTLVGFLKALFKMRDAPVTQIPFKGDIGGPDDPYVTASDGQIRKAVAQFLGEGEFKPKTPEPREEKEKKGGRGDRGGGEKPAEPPPAPQTPPMIDASSSGLIYAQAVDSKKLKIPVQYPTRLVPGSMLSDASRSFPIDGPGSEVYRGYKLVVELQGDAFPEFYGVSGTNWLDPPILENPSETRVISGREYMLYYDGDRLRLVAWQTRKASYWAINTLTGRLSEPQMLAIAQSVQGQSG